MSCPVSQKTWLLCFKSIPNTLVMHLLENWIICICYATVGKLNHLHCLRLEQASNSVMWCLCIVFSELDLLLHRAQVPLPFSSWAEDKQGFSLMGIASIPPHTLSFTDNFVTHHLSHTQLCHTHTLFHTQLSHTHTPSSTHNFVTRSLSHTTFTHTHTPSFTHNFVTHTHTISHNFHTQLCHTSSFFVTHHLSHTTSSHTHTQLFTYNFFPSRSSTTSFVFPSFPVPLQHLLLIIGRSWLVGLSGHLILHTASVKLPLKSPAILSDMTAPRESEACDIFCHLSFSSWQHNVLERAARPVWSQLKPHGIHGGLESRIRWYQWSQGSTGPSLDSSVSISP